MSRMKVKLHEAVGIDHWDAAAPSMFDVVVFERNEAWLRERAREMRETLIVSGVIEECTQIEREMLQEGMSFSIHEGYWPTGVYARTPPGKVTP